MGVGVVADVVVVERMKRRMMKGSSTCLDSSSLEVVALVECCLQSGIGMATKKRTYPIG